MKLALNRMKPALHRESVPKLQGHYQRRYLVCVLLVFSLNAACDQCNLKLDDDIIFSAKKGKTKCSKNETLSRW